MEMGEWNMGIIRAAIAAAVAVVPWFLGLPWEVCAFCFYYSLSKGSEFRKKPGDAFLFLLNCVGMTLYVSVGYIWYLLCGEIMAHQGFRI